MEPPSRICIGVSACLLGEPVRYDGAHRRDPWVCGALAREFELVSICPEVAIGLGVPRRPIRLVRIAMGVRVRDAQDPGNPDLDLTERFRLLAEALSTRLDALGGYVFKSRSPSCGVRDVPLYDAGGRPRALVAGEFARLVMARYPGLPVIDERQLGDPSERERFLGQVRSRYRAGPTAGRVGRARTNSG